MRLIYVANARIPTGKAHGVQIMKMCESFAHLGLEVELWVPTRSNIIKADPFDYFAVKKNFKIVKVPSLDLVRYGRLGFSVQKATFILSSAIRSIFSKAEVFYTRDESFALFASLFNKNVYWEVHTNKLDYLVRMIIGRGMKIVAISNGLRDFLISKGARESNILIAHDGVSVKDFEASVSKSELRDKLGLPQDRFIVAYVGKYTTMGSKKGVDELIASFSNLFEKHKNILLLIVGVNPSEVPILEDLMRKNNVGAEDYSLRMFVPHKDIPSYLKASDALVMNYPATEHYSLYMSPLKMFEYMASSVPVVATDISSVREVLNEENAVLIRPEDPESLYNGLENLVLDPLMGERVSKQAFQDVKIYDWQKRAEKILNFIDKA